MPRVLVVGSANVDFTVALPRLPRPGETVSEGTLLVARGGKGANQAVAARRLGAEVRLIGCVGDDACRAARCARRSPARVSASTRSPRSQEPATGTALIVVDREGRNQIAVAPGANRALTAADVERRAGRLRVGARCVVCSLEVPLPAVRRALEIARAHTATTIVNPAPFPDAGDRLPGAGRLRHAERGRGRARWPDSRSPGSRAPGRPPRPCGRGARAPRSSRSGGGRAGGRPGRRVHAPAFAVTAVDTTGAGDAFNGALAVALGDGARSARRCASPTPPPRWPAPRRGAQPAMPARAEVERLLGG